MISVSSLLSCPLCNRRETCFTSDVDRSDVAVIGRTDASGSFRIDAVIKGDENALSETINGIKLPENQDLIVFGRIERDENSNSTGIERFHQYSISNYGVDYLRRMATASSTDQPLANFLPYLNSPDLSVADDAFYQIARAEYPEFKKLKGRLDREFVIDLFSNPSSVIEIRVMALKMLALCGLLDDAKYPLQMINQSDVQNMRGIDVAMACYLSLRNQAALSDIEQRFITNSNAPHSMKIAIIRALQFHLRLEDRIDKQALMSALRKFADDPDVFDLVIPDLIQMKDWSVLNEVCNVFKANKQRLVRVTAAEYLLACPDETAKPLLAEMRSIDSDAVVQAETGETVFSSVPESKNDASFFTWLLASHFVSPTVLTTIFAISIVSATVFVLKRWRR